MPEPPRPSRLVGVLGGMGPAATVDFYAKLVAATPAGNDQDHLRVVIWADPTVPNRHDALLNGGEAPTPWLEEGVQQLLRCGVDILVVPCNTAHAFMPVVVEGKDVEFISIIEATVAEAQRRSCPGPLGLLAADGAVAAGLYQDAFTSAGKEVVVPSEPSQAVLMEIIRSVKAGTAGDPERQQLSRLLRDLEHQGAHCVIAGCTEVSVLLGHEDAHSRVIDPSRALAEQTVARARA